MKIKVSEATGPVLDWMVAKCLGADFVHNDREYSTISDKVWARGGSQERRYSTDWSQSGPIIERAEIHLLSPYGAHPIPSLAKSWLAHCLKAPHLADGWGPAKGHGPTPLIAAMRCFVASKLGDEIEVPDDFT